MFCSSRKIEVDTAVKPFPSTRLERSCKRTHDFVVEQNARQLKSFADLDRGREIQTISILSYSGLPISAQPIVDEIRAKLAEAPRLQRFALEPKFHVIHQQTRKSPPFAAHESLGSRAAI